MPSPPGKRICIVADYDCDGATACAVALRGLALLGAAPDTLQYVVPDRLVHGYGLTPAIVDLALAQTPAAPPQLLVTVDNGIASSAGVAHARALGLQVLVTDHHLPALGPDGTVQLPEADVIVNPNQPGCGFASKALAGVGVVFYVLLALRSRAARAQRLHAADQQPRLDALLDLVALGTVADVVKLDDNNRRLVAQGLKRIRAGRMQPGVAALFTAAGRVPARASRLRFRLCPGPAHQCRRSAVGHDPGHRMPGHRRPGARRPSWPRRWTPSTASAARFRPTWPPRPRCCWTTLLARQPAGQDTPPALVLFDPDFHEGVVGIVAGRLKDRLHRPTFVLARGQDGLLKGSGRSIAGFHLRDALDLVSKRHPGVLLRFGGHAMAAGCTLAEADWPLFASALQQVAAEALQPRRCSAAWPPTARWAANGSTPPPWPRWTPRSGARASRHRCSATRSMCCSSAWSARST